jgi:hypothetical protein
VLLLLYCDWNVDKISEKYSADLDALYKQAGIIPNKIAPPTILDDDKIECAICGDVVSLKETFALECNDRFIIYFIFLNLLFRFCNECWKKQIAAFKGDKIEFLNIKCLAKNCNMKLKPSDYEKLSDG